MQGFAMQMPRAGHDAVLLDVVPQTPTRNRLTTGGLLGSVIAVVTVIAWFMIPCTGRDPEGSYRFGVGALRWSMRVEAYLLPLRDENPPFSLFPPA